MEQKQSADMTMPPVQEKAVYAVFFSPESRNADSLRSSRFLIGCFFADAEMPQQLQLLQALTGASLIYSLQDTDQGVDYRCCDPCDTALHQHNAYCF